MPAAALAVAPATVPDDPFAFVPADAVVAVAMSGGVDSSVAAARCVERGMRAVGITLAMWPNDQERLRDRGCCSIDAVEDARRVANRLGIRHLVWNLEEEFASAVVSPFEEAYAAGRTPNPCVHCNQRVKFGILLERARAVGATHLATGHYARRGRRGPASTLHRSRDARKDQAYTLHRLDQAQLAAAIFPLGAAESKASVRAEAARLGLGTAAKPDSQELCFVDGTLSGDLSRRLAGRFTPGDIVDLEGRVRGRHRGLPFYTVGQRSGLGLPPDRPDAGAVYVLEIDRERNRLVVGPRDALGRSAVRLADCRWVDGAAPAAPAGHEAQLRAHGATHPATLLATGPGWAELRFAAPVTHVSPGQSLVLYRGDEVLGGGIVEVAE